MVITAIEKRKGSRFAVYLDGECAAVLDAETIYSEGLRVGDEIDDGYLDELMQKVELRRTRERALYLLGRRSHTKKELKDKLLKNAGEELAASVADYMEELGLVNDEDYARRYAEYLAGTKKYGRARIRRELLSKGIDRDLADYVLWEKADEDPKEVITEIIMRKYRQNLTDKKGIDKTINALARLGYEYADIRSAIREICTDMEIYEE